MRASPGRHRVRAPRPLSSANWRFLSSESTVATHVLTEARQRIAMLEQALAASSGADLSNVEEPNGRADAATSTPATPGGWMGAAVRETPADLPRQRAKHTPSKHTPSPIFIWRTARESATSGEGPPAAHKWVGEQEGAESEELAYEHAALIPKLYASRSRQRDVTLITLTR